MLLQVTCYVNAFETVVKELRNFLKSRDSEHSLCVRNIVEGRFLMMDNQRLSKYLHSGNITIGHE